MCLHMDRMYIPQGPVQCLKYATKLIAYFSIQVLSEIAYYKAGLAPVVHTVQ